MGGGLLLLLCLVGGSTPDPLGGSAAPAAPPPSAPPPSAPPQVRCRCASYPNVTLCSWPEPPHLPPPHYIATYRERHRQPISRLCRPIQPGSSWPSERLWHCLLPNLRLLTDYIINVTAAYPGGSSSHLSSFMLEDIVKPDPPVDVRVSPRRARNLLVEWAPPPTWTNLHILPLKYQILYQWETRGGIPTSASLGPLETTRVELKGLTPGRPYLFQVCAKELLGLGECSDWSSPVKVTIPRSKL